MPNTGIDVTRVVSVVGLPSVLGVRFFHDTSIPLDECKNSYQLNPSGEVQLGIFCKRNCSST